MISSKTKFYKKMGVKFNEAKVDIGSLKVSSQLEGM